MTKKPKEQSQKDMIIGLLKKGYSRSQLITDFGLPERSVDAAIKQYKGLHADSSNTKQTKGNGEIKAETLPAKAKTGEGVIPEFIAAEMVNIFDGDDRDQRIFMAGMSVPLMGLRLFAEGVKPFIDLLTVWQRGQAEAAAATQDSYRKIAEEAAAGVAEIISPAFESLKASVTASAPDPFRAMFANAMQPLLGQALGSFGQLLSRWQTRTQQPPSADVQPGQGDVHAPQAGQPGSQPAPGFRQATEDEIKEVFGE